MSTPGLLHVPRALSLPGLAVAVALGIGAILPGLTSTYPWRDIVLFLGALLVVFVACIRPSISIVLAVGTFVFSAGVRRLLPAVDPTADLAAVLPFVVALPLAAHGVRATKPVSATLLIVWVSVRAAFFDLPLVSLAGWLDVAVPFLAAFGIARIRSGLPIFARATVVCGSIAATYGVVQYFAPFPWDVAWLMRSDLLSAGQPGSTNFRPFATFPATGTGAVVAAVVILIMVFRRDLVKGSVFLRTWALASSSVFLLLTQVRSVWLALLAALVFGSFSASDRSARQVLALAAFLSAVVLVLPTGEIVVDRIETLSSLGDDESYLHRVDTLTKTGTVVSPLGLGLGALSSARRVGGGDPIDNGYLIVLGELGLVGAVLFVMVLAWLVRRSRPPEYAFLITLLLTNATTFALGNFPGLLLWALSGVGRPPTTDAGTEEEAQPGALSGRPPPEEPGLGVGPRPTATTAPSADRARPGSRGTW